MMFSGYGSSPRAAAPADLPHSTLPFGTRSPLLLTACDIPMRSRGNRRATATFRFTARLFHGCTLVGASFQRFRMERLDGEDYQPLNNASICALRLSKLEEAALFRSGAPSASKRPDCGSKSQACP